ncbi:MAG: ATP-dependent DNA helicase RecG [Pseudohongiellaceae bacterium]
MTRRTTAELQPVLNAPLLGLPGVGPQRAQSYADAGLHTCRDLLYHLPNRFRARPSPVPVAELVQGERGAVSVEVLRASVRRRGRNSTVSLLTRDARGDELLVLIFNRAYLAKSLPRGTRLWAAGKVEVPAEGRPRLLAADYERLAQADPKGPEGADSGPPGEDEAVSPAMPAALVPIYRLPAGVPPRVHRKAVLAVLAQGPVDDWRDPEPGEMGLAEALQAVHDPEEIETARLARQRLARDEAWALSLQVVMRRRGLSHDRGTALILDDDAHQRLLQRLPHQPTAAQSRVLGELRADLGCDRPMGRLLQGDVGSGKTMIALYALLAAVECGRQGAIMAPTEVLALQHLATLRQVLAQAYGDEAPGVALITGGGRAAERRRVRQGLADGTLALAVGTHGLSSVSVTFADLAVTVVDEQHRFGVRQRVRFRTKGVESHLLVMTATPIPRTLALTAYGELDVSVIDQLPPGRSPRTTAYVPPSKQPRMWRHLGELIAKGQRGYVVCPSIAAGETPGHSVEETVIKIREDFAEAGLGGAGGAPVRVGAVHGKLPGPERDEILDAFRGGELDVLVATVLIEVGLDVPEATFVVLPAPSRFGLATLHQIRGRVGRGREPGACYLLGPVKGPIAIDRLKALCDSEDGFLLAEQDLTLRGPGEVLGTRQSGMPGFLVLDPVVDVELLAATRGPALASSEGLSLAELEALRERAFPATRLRGENLLAGG